MKNVLLLVILSLNSRGYLVFFIARASVHESYHVRYLTTKKHSPARNYGSAVIGLILPSQFLFQTAVEKKRNCVHTVELQ